MNSAHGALNALDTTTGGVLMSGHLAGQCAVCDLRYGMCFLGILIIIMKNYKFALNFIDFNDFMGSAWGAFNALDTTTGGVLMPEHIAGQCTVGSAIWLVFPRNSYNYYEKLYIFIEFY